MPEGVLFLYMDVPAVMAGGIIPPGAVGPEGEKLEEVFFYERAGTLSLTFGICM